MSDPCVDVEKGIATALKEEEKAVHHQFKHLEIKCVKLLLDVYPVLLFVVVMSLALYAYWQNHVWWQIPVVSSAAIANFWVCHKMKHLYIKQNTVASADNDLNTTLLGPSYRNKPTRPNRDKPTRPVS